MHDSAYFLTLTYNEESIPRTKDGVPTLDLRDLQLFFKRLRKRLPGRRIKYYACGEYGSQTRRPHYHAIIFGLGRRHLSALMHCDSSWNNEGDNSRGHIKLGSCTTKSIAYVTGYTLKGSWEGEADQNPEELTLEEAKREFSVMSKKLGDNWLTADRVLYYKTRLINYIELPGGKKTVMPRYYKDKIFDWHDKLTMKDAYLESLELDTESLFESPEHEINWIRWKQNNEFSHHRAKRALA